MPESFPQRSFAPPPDATEVVLVRHGASAAAVPGERGGVGGVRRGAPGAGVRGEPFGPGGGQSAPPLAPEGVSQARAVAARLADMEFAGLFVTTLQRTAQTAAPLAELTGL